MRFDAMVKQLEAVVVNTQWDQVQRSHLAARIETVLASIRSDAGQEIDHDDIESASDAERFRIIDEELN